MLTNTPSPALRYSVNTWPEAMMRIEQHGYLFNVGQIAPGVLTQLYMAQRTGQIKVAVDSYPIRGFPWNGMQKAVFERGCIPPHGDSA